MNQALPILICRIVPALALSLAAALLGVIGCDGESSDRSAMVMQPTPPSKPATQAGETDNAEAQEETADVPVYISIDGEPYEFPPAKLWLKRSGNRVRARLLSDDPPEALERDWSGDSFYFEMDMELPAVTEVSKGGGAETSVSGEVTAEDLESAEWIFRSENSDRTDTRSGIFLGGKAHLQPINVSVLFDQIDETTVMVTLEGVFAEFDLSRPGETTARRQVRVQAALPADAIPH